MGILFLVIFGPGKLPDMARDLGRFVSEARRSVEEFKEDLVSEEENGRDPHKDRSQQTSREIEEPGGHEEGAATDRSTERIEQL